jgi:hypothetical protein
MDCRTIINGITEARTDFEQAVRQQGVGGQLIGSAACKLCASYQRNLEAGSLDATNIDEEQELYRGAELLLVLAAMRLGDEEAELEALRVMGTHNVDARSKKPTDRWARAGAERKRPVKTWRGFQRGGHLERVELSLSASLYELVRQRQLIVCQEALEAYGEEAVKKYLKRLR